MSALQTYQQLVHDEELTLLMLKHGNLIHEFIDGINSILRHQFPHHEAIAETYTNGDLLFITLNTSDEPLSMTVKVDDILYYDGMNMDPFIDVTAEECITLIWQYCIDQGLVRNDGYKTKSRGAQ